jgi:hypothetical protein
MGWQQAGHRGWELGSGTPAPASGWRVHAQCVTIAQTCQPLDARAYFLARERSRAGSHNRRSAGGKSSSSSNVRVCQRSIDPVLPLSLPPCGLSRDAPAQYVGVRSKFDQLTKDGRMPKPIRATGARRRIGSLTRTQGRERHIETTAPPIRTHLDE